MAILKRTAARTLLIVALGLILFEGMAAAPTGAEADDSRFERRREFRKGHLPLPLPSTPDTETPLTRLASVGVKLGAPMLIRIFKAESKLEVWVEKDDVYVPFATYPICFWSGKLGPKLREGDRQTPEGFYTITQGQLHYGRRWKRSLDIGFPNVFDRMNNRTGSLILIHGGCDSVGCFAMTDPVKDELYDLVSWALRSGQDEVPVQVFPFRMTDENLAANTNDALKEFWSDLQRGYESFERTHLPPRIEVCGRRYRVEDARPGARQFALDTCKEDSFASFAKGGSKFLDAAAVAVSQTRR